MRNMENLPYPQQQHPETYPPFPVCFPNFKVPPPPLCHPGPSQHNYQHSMHVTGSGVQNSSPCMPQHTQHSWIPPVHPGYSSPNISEFKSEDERWVEGFLASIAKSNSIPTKISDGQIKTMNICDAEECVGSSICIVQDLKQLESELTNSLSTLSQDEWHEKLSVIQTKKYHLIANLNKFSQPTIECLKSALKKRRKKREARKRQCAIRKNAKIDSQLRRQQLHRTIDTWLEKMQLSVEKAKTEESLKRQADLVLADVTQRKAEARRHVALLSSLLKLRQLRVQIATNRGERVSLEQAKIFDNVSEHLQALWADQMRGYNLEEKGLRVMLEEETQDKKKEVTIFRQHFAEWWRLLFGKNAGFDNQYTIAERDIDAFVAVRRDWDKFLAPAAAPMASAIPIGWVMPAKPSSSEWQQLLAMNQHTDMKAAE